MNRSLMPRRSISPKSSIPLMLKKTSVALNAQRLVLHSLPKMLIIFLLTKSYCLVYQQLGKGRSSRPTLPPTMLSGRYKARWNSSRSCRFLETLIPIVTEFLSNSDRRNKPAESTRQSDEDKSVVGEFCEACQEVFKRTLPIQSPGPSLTYHQRVRSPARNHTELSHSKCFKVSGTESVDGLSET